MTQRRTKFPSEVLDYDFVFTDWLIARGDDMESFVVECDDGIDVQSAVDLGDGVIRLLMHGGVSGRRYKVACDILTEGDRRKRLELFIVVRGGGVAEGEVIGGGSPWDSANPGEPYYGGGSPGA